MDSRGPSHQRRVYDCEAFDHGDGRLLVRGRLTDTKPNGLSRHDGVPLVIHDLAVDLVVRLDGFLIEEVEAVMDVHPYDVCPAVTPDYERLVGVSVARGYSRRVKELFGGPRGCSHLGALLQAMGPVAIQGSWGAVGWDRTPEQILRINADPVEVERQRTLNRDTCHVWASDGPNLARHADGDPPRPQWERDRLAEIAARPRPTGGRRDD